LIGSQEVFISDNTSDELLAAKLYFFLFPPFINEKRMMGTVFNLSSDPFHLTYLYSFNSLNIHRVSGTIPGAGDRKIKNPSLSSRSSYHNSIIVSLIVRRR
jgi:hypothetical protein